MFDASKLMHDEALNEEVATNVKPRRIGLAVALFAGIVILMAIDLAGDVSAGAGGAHVLLEGLVMVLALVGAATLWRGFQAAEERAARLDIDLEAALREARRYRNEAGQALEGLGQAIDSQFDRWKLTAAEREVGLLLLKGLSHREVAKARATSEPTVRQQALGVYRKSGLRNRSELSAFFLEDLLLPRVARPES